MNALIHKIFRLDSDFKKLFFSREFRALSGRGGRNLAALSGIALLTFLALGFAFGGLKKLERRMSDPFTNWVNLDISSGRVTRLVPQIMDKFSRDSMRQRLDLNKMAPYSRFHFTIFHRDFDPFKHAPDVMNYEKWGRDISPDDPVMDKIFDPRSGNVVVAPAEPIGEAMEKNPCGLIVKAEMLTDLGFSLSADSLPTLFVLVKRKNNAQLIYLPVLAIVRELPNLVQFLCSTRLYNMTEGTGNNERECKGYIESFAHLDGGENLFQFWGETGTGRALQEKAERFFKGKHPETRSHELVVLGGKQYEQHTLSFSFVERPDSTSARHFVDSARTVGALPYNNLICGINKCNENTDPNYLAFHFNGLEHIELFKDALKKEYDVDISMDQVESKKNFWLVSLLTRFISIVLLIFGITSVVLFLHNLLKSHLAEIRPHIGTFAAFGLSERFISGVYQKITFGFVALSVGVALLLSVVVDVVCRQIWGIESPFNIWNAWIPGAVAGLFLFSYLISGRTIAQLLDDTPGNLIYER